MCLDWFSPRTDGCGDHARGAAGLPRRRRVGRRRLTFGDWLSFAYGERQRLRLPPRPCGMAFGPADFDAGHHRYSLAPVEWAAHQFVNCHTSLVVSNFSPAPGGTGQGLFYSYRFSQGVVNVVFSDPLSRNETARRFKLGIASAMRWVERFWTTDEILPKSSGRDHRSGRAKAHLPGLIRRKLDITPP